MRLLNWALVPLAGAGVVHMQHQVPMAADSEDVGSRVLLGAGKASDEGLPMVGVHFTTSYAIASVRYQNGTLRDLGKIVGDAEYVEVMSRWAEGRDDVSLDCSNHPNGLLYGSFNTGLPACQKNRLERDKRVEAGLAESRDSAVLADFMNKVREGIEEELDQPVEHIAPAFPRLSPYAGIDLRKAFTHAGLRSTKSSNPTPVYEESYAAYAALGHGLCDPSMSRMACENETKQHSYETVLYFNFDNSSFSIGAMVLNSPFEQSPTLSYGANTQLGWWNLPVFTVPRARFWAQIHEMVAAAVRNIRHPWKKILLLGEHGADKEFKEVVKAAVWEVLEMDVELMLDLVANNDVARLAARGAAELGFREEMWRRLAEGARREGKGEGREL